MSWFALHCSISPLLGQNSAVRLLANSKASAKGARSVPDSLQQELRSRPRKLLLLVFAAVNLVAPVLRLNLRPRILGAHNWRLRTVRQGKMKTLSLVLLLDVAADDQRWLSNAWSIKWILFSNFVFQQKDQQGSSWICRLKMLLTKGSLNPSCVVILA